jgi:pteridine reductase
VPTVIITGGAKRIGRGLATAYQARGWNVGIIHRSGLPFWAAGNKAIANADVGNAAELRAACTMLAEYFGSVEVIVSNAGVFYQQEELSASSTEHLQQALQVNTLPLVTLADWYNNHCTNGDSFGRLIAITSLGAHQIWKDRLAYNVSKSALVTTVNSLARSLAPMISVNAVAPGAIVFPDEHTVNDTNVQPAENIPMKRYGNADDVFDAVWFFSTCTRYITAQHVIVDGGYHLTTQ